MTKRKSISILVIAIITILATVGISFALWDAKPVEYSYTVGTETFSTVKIENITTSSTKLMPNESGSEAAVSVTDFKLAIERAKNKITVSVIDMEYLDGEEWLPLPSGVLSVEVYLGTVIIPPAYPLEVGNNYDFHIKTKMIQNIDIIDPIYKNTQFRFTINIDCEKVVEPKA